MAQKSETKDKSLKLIVNILPLIPAMIRGVEGAEKVYNDLVEGLRDGISDEEWQSAIAERDAVFDRIAAKAEADADKVAAGA